MGTCTAQVFPDFTSECLRNLGSRLQAEGLDTGMMNGLSEGTGGAAGGGSLTPPAPPLKGQASKAGFEITWEYDAATLSLTIQCVSSPFYAPCTAINAQIKNWVSACYPVPPAASKV